MLRCCVCLYSNLDVQDAITVIRGYAVCGKHIGYVAQGQEWHRILDATKSTPHRPLET